MAGNDPAELKRLERFASPDALYKSYRQIEGRLSSGELKSQLAKDATPEQLTAWRKENGIPADEKAYAESIKLPAGLVPAESDKPLIESFVKDVALAKNLSPEVASEAVAWFMNKQDAIKQDQIKKDGEYHDQTLTVLGQEWGKDFNANKNAIGNLRDSVGTPEEWDFVANARTPDGQLLGNHTTYLKLLAATAREANPTSTLVPSGTGNSTQAVNDEIGSINKMIADKTSDYWNGPNRDTIQARYRELLTASEKVKSRAA